MDSTKLTWYKFAILSYSHEKVLSHTCGIAVSSVVAIHYKGFSATWNATNRPLIAVLCVPCNNKHLLLCSLNLYMKADAFRVNDGL